MKGINKLITILLFIAVFVLLFFQLNQGNDNPVQSNYDLKMDSISDLYQQERSEKERLKNLNDSLSTQLIDIMDEGGEDIVESGDEAEIKQLINDLHKGWESLVNSKDPDDVLQYFTEEFTTNEVKINTENLPFVRKHNNKNYREHLEAIAEIDGLDIDMGASKIFSVFVRENIFATQYLTEVKLNIRGR